MDVPMNPVSSYPLSLSKERVRERCRARIAPASELVDASMNPVSKIRHAESTPPALAPGYPQLSAGGYKPPPPAESPSPLPLSRRERIEGEGPYPARVFSRAIQDSSLLQIRAEVMQSSPITEHMRIFQ